MPRTAAKVTQADIARVLRAVAQNDGRWRIEIEDGKISVEQVEDTPRSYSREIKL